MTKHIHIHISTRDAGFNEGDHPRDHGKFTSGGGSSAPAKKGPVDRDTTVGKAAHQLSDAELHDRIQGVSAKHREWVGKSKRGMSGAKEKADAIHQQLKVLQAHQANRKSGFTQKKP